MNLHECVTTSHMYGGDHVELFAFHMGAVQEIVFAGQVAGAPKNWCNAKSYKNGWSGELSAATSIGRAAIFRRCNGCMNWRGARDVLPWRAWWRNWT